MPGQTESKIDSDDKKTYPDLVGNVDKDRDRDRGGRGGCGGG